MENRFETFTVLVNHISRNIRKIKNQEMAGDMACAAPISPACTTCMPILA